MSHVGFSLKKTMDTTAVSTASPPFTHGYSTAASILTLRILSMALPTKLPQPETAVISRAFNM